MEPFLIDTRDQYDLCKAHGIEPLIDRRFAMEIRLRVSIQRELFGTGHTPAENERFYRWCWDHYPHQCAETMRPLRQYSATYISHILTRGAHPESGVPACFVQFNNAPCVFRVRRLWYAAVPFEIRFGKVFPD